MEKGMSNTTIITPPYFYKPSELMGTFRNFLSNNKINARVLTLQGIYLKSDKIYGTYAYDQLKDENTSESLTIIVPLSLRENLQNGNLVNIQGTLSHRVQNNGSIQIILNVSRVNKVKDIAISEDEIKRAEFRRKKGESGYKNIDGILENKLFTNQRPRVALIYADSSITNADFEKGLNAARSNIDFTESRVSFANSRALCERLKYLDTQKYDVIAIVRGGGSGIEKLDDINVVEVLTNLRTAWIYGVGHEKEQLFIRNIADKVIPIPFALGTYFRDLVDTVIQKRNNSRAALVREVREQYIKQIEDSNKRNQNLTKQLENLQKQNKEQNEASQKQIANLTKAQQESQKQSKSQTEAAEKVNKELQQKLEEQGKTLANMQSQQHKQQTDFNNNLRQMQNTNRNLQATVTRMTNELMTARQRVSELENKKPNIIVFVIVIIAIVLIILTIIVFINKHSLDIL